MSLRQVHERMAKYAYVFLGVGAAVVAAGGLASYRLLRRPIARMHAITTEARAISARSLDQRLRVTGAGDEFDDLAATLNEMLDRLAASVRSLERFVADAAHELRSPVARLRAAAEVALRSPRLSLAEARATLADICRQADAMTRLVDDLLLLAREEAGPPTASGERVDAAALLEEVVGLYEGAAEEKGLDLRLVSAEAGTVRGRRQRLLRALGNLIDNAVKFTPPGGRVEVGGSADGTVYRFAVSDTGPGIPPDHLPHVFERFYRSEPARGTGGTGLGLSIVQAIARAHGGEVAVESEPGRGSRFTLTLPLAS